GPYGFGALKVRFRRADCLDRCFQVLLREKGVIVGLGDSVDELHPGSPLLFGCQTICELRGFNSITGLATVIEHLVERYLRLKIVEEVWTVEWSDIEVRHAKLMLRQQGAEDEHRVIAAGEGL